jgi:hypothetical protein
MLFRNNDFRLGVITQMVECLTSKYEALCSNPRTVKKKKKKNFVIWKMLSIVLSNLSPQSDIFNIIMSIVKKNVSLSE